MFYLSSYFGRNSARQPRLNILLMCIMPPLEFALHKNSLNGSEPCWRWALNSLSRARKREIIHRTNNLIVSESIKTDEDTKTTLWRLLMCPKTYEIEQLLRGVLLCNSFRRAFQGHFPTIVCVCVCGRPHVVACAQTLASGCAFVWWIAFGDAWENINRIQAMWVTKHY